ncbi:MAG: hypothetical protein WDZ79_01375 [Candidatus Paceibacterota bacterium]
MTFSRRNLFFSLSFLTALGFFVLVPATPVSAQACDAGADLSATINASPSGGTHSATFTNSSLTCEYEIGLAAYKKVNDIIDDQIIFEDSQTSIAADSSLVLNVTDPDCAYQIDAFYGERLPDLNGQRYGDRLLHARHMRGIDYCSGGGTDRNANPPIIDSFKATKYTLNEGATTTLTWESRNTTECSGSGFITKGDISNTNGVIVQPTETTEYVLSCRDLLGNTVSKKLLVSVNEEALSLVELTADPSTIAAGGSTTLEWVSQNATTCTSSSFATNGAVAGNVLVTPNNAASYPYTVTYVVSCTNPWGEAWDTVSVTVVAEGTVILNGEDEEGDEVAPSEGAVTASLSADPATIIEGEGSWLRWESTNAIMCEGVGGGTAVSGAVVVSPVKTTGYQVVCTDESGENASDWAWVTVEAGQPEEDEPSMEESDEEGEEEADENSEESEDSEIDTLVRESVTESSDPSGEPAPGVVDDGLAKRVVEGIEIIRGVTGDVHERVKNILETPTGGTVARTISTAGVVAGGVASLSVIFLSPLTVGEIFLVPLRLWALLLSLLGLKKKYRPWGTVYDSVTKQPLDPAYVVFQDQNGEEVATSITDLDGRYGFVAQKGTYHIVANKTNYRFPSLKLAGQTEDELYSDLYFGGEFEIQSDGKTVIRNIPMDPEDFDWNEFKKRDKKLMKFYSKRDVIWSKLVTAFFYFGLIVALLALWVAPAPYNLIIFGLYVVMLVVRFFGLKPRTYGHLVDAETGVPLSFAIVRVYQEGQKHEITHKVADEYGRFYCLIPKGRYYLEIDRKNSDESYSHVHTTPIVNAKNGIIKGTFEV